MIFLLKFAFLLNLCEKFTILQIYNYLYLRKTIIFNFIIIIIYFSLIILFRHHSNNNFFIFIINTNICTNNKLIQ